MEGQENKKLYLRKLGELQLDPFMQQIIAGKQFLQEQREWLGLIREHLVQNLSIELEDFRVVPIFERRGGLVKAQKVFEGKLPQLVKEINYRVAA